VKWPESLLHTESVQFELKKLESCFHKRQVSFLVVKTVSINAALAKLSNFKAFDARFWQDFFFLTRFLGAKTFEFFEIFGVSARTIGEGS